ncbi:MAG: hypothetical protein ACKO5K_15490 [Armatimonadota bacterium]
MRIVEARIAWASVAAAAILVCAGLTARPPTTFVAPYPVAVVRIVLVSESPPDLRGASDWAMVPARGFDNATRTGEREPEANAETIGPFLRRHGVALEASSAAGWEWLGASPGSNVPEVPGKHPVPGARVEVVERVGWEGTTEPGSLEIRLPRRVETGSRFAHLRLVESGPSVVGTIRSVGSPSTRTPGLVAGADIPATIAQACGIVEPFGTGRSAGWSMGTSSGADGVAGRTRWQDPLMRWRWGVPLILSGALLVAWFRPRSPLSAIATWFPLALGCLEVVSWTARDFSTGNFMVEASAARAPIVFGVAVLLSVGLGRARFGDPLLAAALGCVALTADAALGFPSQRVGAMGFSVAESARFHGIGNETAGLWIGWSALLMVRAGLPGAAMAAVSAVAIGAPGLGANAGCAVAAAGLAIAGCVAAVPRRRRLATAALGVVIGIGAVGWVAVRDSQLPEARRSHVGRAAAQMLAGKSPQVLRVARRKVAMNLRLMVRSPWAVLLWTGGCVGWAGMRAGRRIGSAWVGPALALCLNDSGVVAAALATLPLVAPEKKEAVPADAETASVDRAE